MHKLGTIFFLPFNYSPLTEIISWVVVLVSIIFLVRFSKKQNKLKAALLWWLIGMIPVLIIFTVLGKVFYPSEGIVSFSGIEGLLAAILWFLYFPIISSIYFFLKIKN